MAATIVGIFVGGLARRLGGTPKGLLESPLGGKLVERLARVAREAIADSKIVLVGEHPAYRSLEIPSLVDEPAGIGPIGGLSALLEHGVRSDAEFALALACDLPFISTSLVEKIGTHPSPAAAIAPYIDGRWQPLFARYRPGPALDATRAAIAAGERALQRVLGRLGDQAFAIELSAREIEELRDWDEPADLVR